MTMFRHEPDAELQAVDGSASVLLYLANQANNIRVRYLRLTPPQIADGTVVGYASIDPEQDMVLAQTDWSNGAGLYLQREGPEYANRYALADGAVSMAQGSIGVGYKFLDINIPGAVAAGPDAEWRAQPVEFRGKLYAAYDQYLYQLDTEGESFTLKHTFAHPVLSIEVYDGRIYFTFVGQRNYSLSANLDVNNIAFESRALPTDLPADCMFARARNADGGYSLVAVDDNGVALSSDPHAQSATWSTAEAVGEPGAKLLSLKTIRDVLYIGKTNGLWYYDTSGEGNFVNIEPQIGTGEETERYRSLESFGHSLFASYSEGGVWRIYNPETDAPSYVDVRSRFNFYAYRGRSGQIRAMLTNHGYVLALGEGRLFRQRKTFPIDWDVGIVWDDGSGASKSHRLILFDPTNNTSHSIGLLSFTTADRMAKFITDEDSFHVNVYIFGSGRATPDATESTPIIRLLQIPRDDITPYRSTFAGNAETGWLTTQWFDNYFPDWNKILTRLTVYCSGLAEVTLTNGAVTSGARIKVEYRTQENADAPDESDTWALMGYITENRFQHLPENNDRQNYFRTPIKYKRIRFKFTFETDGGTAAIIEQVVMHSLLSSENRRRYLLAMDYADNTLGPTPQTDLYDLIKLKESNDVFRFIPASERLDWLGERLVTIADIGPDTEGVFGSGDPGDQGQRAVHTVLDLIDLPPAP